MNIVSNSEIQPARASIYENPALGRPIVGGEETTFVYTPAPGGDVPGPAVLF